jgi:hypothetical protein
MKGSEVQRALNEPHIGAHLEPCAPPFGVCRIERISVGLCTPVAVFAWFSSMFAFRGHSCLMAGERVLDRADEYQCTRCISEYSSVVDVVGVQRLR